MEAAELPEKMRERMFRYLCQKESRYTRLKRQKMTKEMFELVKHIGIGAFGKVSLVRKVGQACSLNYLIPFRKIPVKSLP